MPTIRQRCVATVTRRYPFYSGCGTFANMPIIRRIAGDSDELAWAPVSGGVVLSPLNDYLGRAAFYAGDWDRKITWICTRLVKPGDTVLDIGANIGINSLCLAKLVGTNGAVHAFEPNPRMCQLLQRTLDHNRVSNCRLHPYALGRTEGICELRCPKGNAAWGSLVSNEQIGECDVYQVPVRPLSTVLAEEGIQSIRLVKIDVEGFESNVVVGGGRAFLATVRPQSILFELKVNTQSPVSGDPIVRILADFDYGFFLIPRCLARMRLLRLDPHRPSRVPARDVLAAPLGAAYEAIAALVGA